MGRGNRQAGVGDVEMTTTSIAKLEAHEFASALMLMKVRAGQLGFYKTMHALEPATQAIGWEIADKIEAETKVGTKEDEARRKRAAAERYLHR